MTEDNNANPANGSRSEYPVTPDEDAADRTPHPESTESGAADLGDSRDLESPGELGEAAVTAFRRAEELVARRRPREAIKTLNPVLDAVEDKPSVQLLLGRAYYFAAQLGRAESAFARVLELDPSDHYARLALGRTLQRQGRLSEARAQLRLAATMYPAPAYQEALSEINANIAVRHG